MSTLRRRIEGETSLLHRVGERCRHGFESLVRMLRQSEARRTRRKSTWQLAFDLLEARDVPSATTYQFSLACVTVGEGAGSALITVNRTGDVSASGNAFYSITNGTATSGQDFTGTAGNVFFNAGATAASFAIPILEDSIIEGNEYFNVALTSATVASSASSAVLGTITVDTVTIDDDDEIGNFYFSSASYTVGEAAGSASITVYRSLSCSTDHLGTATVHYSASDGTANSPADYTLTPGILSFAAGVTAMSFSVPIVDDLIGEPTEYFNLALSSATNGASINGWISGPSASVSIVDNDDGGSFGYGQSTYTYSEIYGATISVTRTPMLGGGVNSLVTATVNYAISGGTATSADYTFSNGSLTFGAEQNTASLWIPFVDDHIAEPTETLILSLLSPTNHSMIGSPSTTTISILDDDHAPTNIGLSNASVNEHQAAGATVGTLSATDSDTGETDTYTLVSGTGGDDNASFTISGNTLKTAANFNCQAKNSYSVRVQVTDHGGLTYQKSFTVSVNNINDAPVAVSKAISFNENTSYTFSSADFGFSDPSDTPSNNFSAAIIPTLPAKGSLTLGGVAVTAGQSILASQFGNLVYAPITNDYGASYASFQFKVQDDGGTANGGQNTSGAYLFSIAVTQYATTTTIASSKAAPAENEPITLTSVVAAAAGGTPTGTVDFYLDNQPLGSATLDVSDTATYTLSGGLSAGTHHVTATYEGNILFASSNASPATIVVQPIVGVPDVFSGLHGTVVAGNVLTNDVAPGTTTLTALKLSDPTNGSVNFNPNGTFTYTPSGSGIYSDSFTYSASNGFSSTGPITVNIEMSNGNLVWNGAGSDNFGSTAENWVQDVAPLPGDSVTFDPT